jgi:hypothetical protein
MLDETSPKDGRTQSGQQVEEECTESGESLGSVEDQIRITMETCKYMAGSSKINHFSKIWWLVNEKRN